MSMSDSEETILDPISSSGRVMPRVTSCSIPPGRFSRKRRRNDWKDFYHVPQHHKPNTYVKFIFLRTSPLKAGPPLDLSFGHF